MLRFYVILSIMLLEITGIVVVVVVVRRRMVMMMWVMSMSMSFIILFMKILWMSMFKFFGGDSGGADW